MGRFSIDEFTWQDKPDLSQLAKELDGKDPQEIKKWAETYVTHCPCEDMAAFRTSIEASKSSAVKQSAFYEALNSAYFVRQSIEAVLDPKNTIPARFFLTKQYGREAFDQHRDMALNLVSGREQLLIETMMAKTTDNKVRSELCQNLRHAFGAGSQMDQFANRAAMMMRQVEMLAGERACRAFLSEDFSVDAYHQFQTIIDPLIQGQASIIAKALATNDEQQQSRINRKLEQLAPTAMHKQNIFHEIRQQLAPQSEQARASSAGMFGNKPAQSPQGTPESSEHYDDVPLTTPAKEPGCCVIM